MKTQIGSRIIMLGLIFILAIYAVFFQSTSTKSVPEYIPAFKNAKRPSQTQAPTATDSLRNDTLKHQEQTIKKLDFKMYKRSMYMHRKPFVV